MTDPKSEPSEATDWYPGITEKHYDAALRKAVRAALAPAPAQPEPPPSNSSNEPVGRCCYGGRKPRSACASCSAWKPEPPTTAGVEPVAQKLAAALREAMHQAVAYDGIDLSLIGPKHWYSEAKVLLDAIPATPPTLTDAQIRAEERERCAKALNIGRGDALLACGEMSAQEWRTASAMLVWLQGRIRAAAAGGG